MFRDRGESSLLNADEVIIFDARLAGRAILWISCCAGLPHFRLKMVRLARARAVLKWPYHSSKSIPAHPSDVENLPRVGSRPVLYSRAINRTCIERSPFAATEKCEGRCTVSGRKRASLSFSRRQCLK